MRLRFARSGPRRATLACLALVCGVPAGAPACTGDRGQVIQDRGDKRGGADERRPHELDLGNRTVRERIEPDVQDPERVKLVQFDVRSVENPERLPLSFEVFFESADAARTRLGTFALFPADKPGRFLVPTGGRLRQGGAVVVEMLVLQETGPDDRVRVVVERFTLRRR